MFPRVPLPERIGPYRVLRRLPSTGGADRYLGREEGPRGFTRMVELKLAPAEDDPEVASELAHEAAVVAKLNHPYITRMYNFLEYEGRLVLVLERVEGTTLGRILSSARRRKQQFPDDAVFHIAHRLMSAIAHAHGMTDEDGQRTPVVHRAISPAALLVAWNGEVRLSGFGLAKIMGRSPDTAVGMVKGTPGYMAPEQLRGERVTERTDIYQAGLVIWEMLAGQPPPAASASPATPPRSRQGEGGSELTSVSILRPTVPREIAAVIDAMLEPAVERRKISATEVERWLAKTVDVERGREALRERAITLRGQEARDAGAEPTRGTATSVRRAAPLRRGAGGSGEVTMESAPSRRSGPRAAMNSPQPDVAPSSDPVMMAVTPTPVGLTVPPAVAAATPPPVPKRVGKATLIGVAPAPATLGQSATGTPLPSPAETPAMPMAAPLGANTPTPPPAAVEPLPPPVPSEPVPVLATPFESTPVGPSLARVTMPEPMPMSGPRPMMPVEGERGANTLITRRPRRTLLIGGGVLGGAILLAIVAAAVHRTTPPTGLPSASASSSSSAPPPEPPPVPVVTATTTEPAPLPELGPKQGALRVKASRPGDVYVNGALAGPTDKVLVTNCGQRYIRVGASATVRGRTLWLGPGQSVKIACGVLTEVEALPGR